MQIGFAQFEPKIGQAEANRREIQRFVAEARHADLLVFPELAVSGYDFTDAEHAAQLAEPFDTGPTATLLRTLAAEHNTTIVAGYPERAPEGLYNAAMTALPDGSLVNYRKIHLFSRETLFFLPGDAPPPVIQTPHARVGVMICFDWIFPETARSLALAGAQIIAHPSNLVMQYCQRAMYCRSVENRVFTVTANRIGTETTGGRTLTFTGASQMLSPDGETLSRAPVDRPYLAVANIDPALADSKRLNEFNDVFKDRRPDLYA